MWTGAKGVPSIQSNYPIVVFHTVALAFGTFIIMRGALEDELPGTGLLFVGVMLFYDDIRCG